MRRGQSESLPRTSDHRFRSAIGRRASAGPGVGCRLRLDGFVPVMRKLPPNGGSRDIAEGSRAAPTGNSYFSRTAHGIVAPA